MPQFLRRSIGLLESMCRALDTMQLASRLLDTAFRYGGSALISLSKTHVALWRFWAGVMKPSIQFQVSAERRQVTGDVTSNGGCSAIGANSTCLTNINNYNGFGSGPGRPPVRLDCLKA